MVSYFLVEYFEYLELVEIIILTGKLPISMKRRKFIATAGAGAVAGASLGMTACNTEDMGKLAPGHIQHGVIFSLKVAADSPEAAKFLEDGRKTLTEIPVVNNFQAFRQVSPKNEYDFGFTMVFETEEDYQTYNNHPNHVAFVEDRWMKEVEKFLEIDFLST